ncbi:hypothetical+protein [Methylocapsa aurea]|uniref:hypothetical protein n=1 Tax=Methylocapsa aurea TaxID=663610 RepID=UPI003D18C37A
MSLKDLTSKYDQAVEQEKRAKEKTKEARAALKCAKRNADVISNTAIMRALRIGYEKGWVQADVEKLEALAPTLLSAKNRDLTSRLLEILRGSRKSDPVVADVAEESTAPEDELDRTMAPFPEPRPGSERSDSGATNATSSHPEILRDSPESDPVVIDMAEEPADERDRLMKSLPQPRPSSERSDPAATNSPPSSPQQARFNRPIRPLGQTPPDRASSE